MDVENGANEVENLEYVPLVWFLYALLPYGLFSTEVPFIYLFLFVLYSCRSLPYVLIPVPKQFLKRSSLCQCCSKFPFLSLQSK